MELSENQSALLYWHATSNQNVKLTFGVTQAVFQVLVHTLSQSSSVASNRHAGAHRALEAPAKDAVQRVQFVANTTKSVEFPVLCLVNIYS